MDSVKLDVQWLEDNNPKLIDHLDALRKDEIPPLVSGMTYNDFIDMQNFLRSKGLRSDMPISVEFKPDEKEFHITQ